MQPDKGHFARNQEISAKAVKQVQHDGFTFVTLNLFQGLYYKDAETSSA